MAQVAYKPEIVEGKPGYQIAKFVLVPGIGYRKVGLVEKNVSDADIDTFLQVLEGTDAPVVEAIPLKPVKFQVRVSCRRAGSKAIIMIPLTKITWEDTPGAKPFAVKKVWRPSNEDSLRNATPLTFSKIAAEAVSGQMQRQFGFLKSDILPVEVN